jgi:hypothetical protein
MSKGDNSITRCKKRFCPKFILRQQELTKKILNNVTRKLKGVSKNGLSKIKKNIRKGVFNNSVMKEKMLEECRKGYCNPSCKNTMYEAGSQFPKSLEEEIKKKENGEILFPIIKSLRKGVFKGKKNVLNNNFYEKLPKEGIDKIKKQGAISACTAVLL